MPASTADETKDNGHWNGIGALVSCTAHALVSRTQTVYLDYGRIEH